MAITAAGMKARYEGKIASLTAQTSNPAEAAAAADTILLSLFQAIVEEIQANSELVPVTTDSGTAGAGIITGKVR
jgi:hypothetical protein